MNLSFGKHSHGTQIYSDSVSIGEVYPHVSSQDCLVTFSSCTPFSSLIAKLIARTQVSLAIFPSGKMNNQMFCFKFYLLRGLPLTSTLQSLPVWGCSAPDAHMGWYQHIVHMHLYTRFFKS